MAGAIESVGYASNPTDGTVDRYFLLIPHVPAFPGWPDDDWLNRGSYFPACHSRAAFFGADRGFAIDTLFMKGSYIFGRARIRR